MYLKKKSMKAYVFPGQGAQFSGMGKELYKNSNTAKKLFEKANTILGFNITKIMFEGSEDELKQTKVTQPSIFLHSVILAKVLGEKFQPDLVAGHSLGEFSALVAAKYLTFENGLKIVSKRAKAMQKACEKEPSTMAAILGLEDKIVESVCKNINEIVVPANYNCPGQLVISGSKSGIDNACEKLKEKGARRALILPVGGAFHSPLMESARLELKTIIDNTNFKQGICPIYQNVNALPEEEPQIIKENIIKQLTAPVLWTQTMELMIKNNVTNIIEVGPGKVLQGLFKKIDRSLVTESANL
tara:strand:- start:3835 stop:4737 length:903 start_codon:yes stop_codon:yes gene_type:complete